MHVDMMNRFHTGLLLTVICLIAIGMRVWGIAYDLPNIYHPDEPRYIVIGQTIFRTGDLNPHFFNYPSLLFYVNSLSYIPYYLIGMATGEFQNREDVRFPLKYNPAIGVARTNQPSSVLLGRLISVCFSVGSVLLSYLITVRITRKTYAGLVAGALMALSLPNVVYGRLVTPNSLLIFFVLASLWAAVGILQQGKPRHYIAAGLFLGLAASSKYNGAAAAVLLLAAHFVRHGSRGIKKPLIYGALGIGCLAFVATTPYAALDYKAFTAGLAYEATHYATGHAGMEGDTPVWYFSYLLRTIWPILLLAVFQIVQGIRKRSTETVLLLLFPVVYFLLVSRFEVRNDRTILPVVPFFFLLAAVASTSLFAVARALKKRRRRVLSLATALLLTLCLVQQTVATVRDNLQLGKPDSREAARIWVHRHIPEGAQIAIESYAPFIDYKRYRVWNFVRIIDNSPEWYEANNFNYLVFSEGIYGRYFRNPVKHHSEVLDYTALFNRFRLVESFTQGGFEIRIYRVAW